MRWSPASSASRESAPNRPGRTPGRRWLPHLILGCGVAAISFGAILARVAQAEAVPSLVVAALRLGLAALIVTPLVLWQAPRALFGLGRRQLGLALGAGVCLAAHFATWISSLEFTSVASSTALVTTNLLWVGLAGFLLFGERPSRLMLAGGALALGGSLLIFIGDYASSPGRSPLLGNFLALAGSWCFSAYLLIGRRLRNELPLPAYVWLAYAVAALFLVLACLVVRLDFVGYSLPAYAAILGLAIGPQLLGHTAYNWSLRHVSTAFVAVVTLGEPVGSAALAWLIFGETFSVLQGAGFALLLGGIYLAARGEGR